MSKIAEVLTTLARAYAAENYQEAILDYTSMIEDICDKLKEVSKSAQADFIKMQKSDLGEMAQMASEMAEGVYGVIGSVLQEYVQIAANKSERSSL